MKHAAGFRRILKAPEGPRRTAAIAEWIQAAFETPPVLVGGAAVELYTRGAYTTGDFDFAGGVPAAVARRFEAEGFRREGRHWIHEEGEVFVEFPSSSLDPEEKTTTLKVSGHKVLTVRPEVLIVDLLASWESWKSGVDGVNAFLVLKARRSGLDQRYLSRLAKARGVAKPLESLRRFAKRFSGWRDREMGRQEALIRSDRDIRLPALPPRIRRSKPRSFPEWKALHRWGKLPPWENDPAGYRMRLAREEAGLTQTELARRLGCSQQAVAQAERWRANPTVDFLRRWAEECGESLEIDFRKKRDVPRG